MNIASNIYMQDVYNKTEYKNKTNKMAGRNDIRPHRV